MDYEVFWDSLCQTVQIGSESHAKSYPPLAAEIRESAKAFCDQPTPKDETEFHLRHMAHTELVSSWSFLISQQRLAAIAKGRRGS